MNINRTFRLFLIFIVVLCIVYLAMERNAHASEGNAVSSSSNLLSLLRKQPLSPSSSTYTVCKIGCDYTRISDAIQDCVSGDIIDLATETYTETVIISESVTIQGDGAANTIVQARGDDDSVATSRVFDIEPDLVVTIEGITIKNGNSVPRGAGIRNRGYLTLRNSSVISNTASECGGGIYNWARDAGQQSDLIIENSIISNNEELNSVEGYGGGLYNYAKDGAAIASLEGSLVTNNTAVYGGGISNHAADGYALFTILNSSIRDNTGLMISGGIDNRTELPTAKADLIIDRTTIDGNETGNNGGGVLNESIYGTASVDITNSTLSNNEAIYGAGVANIATNETAVITLTNVTISSNVADVAAGVWNKEDYGEANLEIIASTINANTANLYYAGIWNFGTGIITMTGSIAANNIGLVGMDGADCSNSSGTFINNGYNIIETGGGDCGTTGDGDPSVGMLTNNGGPTLTHALLPGSIAINAIPTQFCLVPKDQRGILRPIGNGCDIGSFEYQPIIYLPCIFK